MRIEAQQPQMVVKSPHDDLTMTLAIRSPKGEEAPTGQLVYSVRYRDKIVLEESMLGLDLEGGALLGAKVHVMSNEPGSGTDDYTLATGKSSHVHDPYQSLRVTLAEDGAAARMSAPANGRSAGPSRLRSAPRPSR